MDVHASAPDPALVIPYVQEPPKIDGRILPGEWKYAAGITLLENIPGRSGPRVVRLEQPAFFILWDDNYLYVAMDSLYSNTNRIVSACSQKDNRAIIGDDCVEMMVAPGCGDDINRIDFPVYYLALNAIGTLWDAKLFPLLAEEHNSWQSGAEIANTVDGTRWVMEMRVPLRSISPGPPKEGTTWRMNFCRTYQNYHWTPWIPGGLNDARTGGDVTFSRSNATVRIMSGDALIDGYSQVVFEVSNPTDKKQAITLKVKCLGRPEQDADLKEIDSDQKTVTVGEGEIKEVRLGNRRSLMKYNTVTISAENSANQQLLFMERSVQIPALRFVKRAAPAVSLVYIFPRFLPSIEKLAVVVDYTAWAKNTGFTGDGVKAEVEVYPKAGEKDSPVIKGTLTEFADNRGVLRRSTENLPEGEYTVKVKVYSPAGEKITEYDDWFEKRIFDWMVKPTGVGDKVPAPFTPLEVAGTDIIPWGRKYGFTRAGLLGQVISQDKKLLAEPMQLLVDTGNGISDAGVKEDFRITSRTDAEVRGSSKLKQGNLQMEIETVTEYDGFVLFRLTYGPGTGSADVKRMRLRVPLDARYTKFYSAAGDKEGVTILGNVLPDKQGPVFDSLNNTYGVTVSPTFATLFWVGDYETSFCYAADNCKGWILRDDAPAVEVHREGNQLVLWLNLVDRQSTLKESRTLEFAFQSGPVKPLPEGWRGRQHGGNPEDAPLTLRQVHIRGTGGGTLILHPGDTEERQAATRKRLEPFITGDNIRLVGYHYWGTIPKGRPEARVFRGEWGIDKETWEKGGTFREYEWSIRQHGDNRDDYIYFAGLQPRPSYVDFLTHAYDMTLQHTPLYGFYDDTGYPKSVYDEELGLGYIREDGRKISSSGLWIYRERWKRAAYVNFLHGKENFLLDSQHVQAHWMPAYGFIGIWAPCEKNFYNPFLDRDNLGFYGTVERYYSINPSHVFGQQSMIGMGSSQWEKPLFARDTRNMMMLALLHDQDVGSYGSRCDWTVKRIRAARNILRPWEKDVQFTGYWKSGELVRKDREEILLSFYRKNDGLLFILGNTGFEDQKVTLIPEWQKLGIGYHTADVFDPETGDSVEIDKNGRLEVSVKARDLRLVLACRKGAYKPKTTKLGTGLLTPKQVLENLTDRFTGLELANDWEKSLHEGFSGIWPLNGRLCIQGNLYGYTHVRRKLGMDNVSVQCLIMNSGTGNDLAQPGLFLYWNNGEYIQAVPGTEKFTYALSGKTQQQGSMVSNEPVFGWTPYRANWVKILMTQNRIIFFSSSDGKNWVEDASVPRDERFAGAPECVILGRGFKGDTPYLQNVETKHFNPNTRSTDTAFFSDLIVGKE